MGARCRHDVHFRSPALVAMVLLAPLSACTATTGPVTLAPPTRHYTPSNYEPTRVRWTRAGSVLRELDTTLRLYATLRSPRFEAAYLAKRAEIFALPKAEVAKLRRAAHQERQDSFTFVVIAATYDLAWNDFDQHDSRWRLSLVNDRGDQVAPKSITRRRRVTETDIAFFPQLGKLFHQRYDVRFPRRLPNGSPLVTPQTRSLTLRAAGALGKIELVWKLEANASNVALSPRRASKAAPPAISSP